MANHDDNGDVCARDMWGLHSGSDAQRFIEVCHGDDQCRTTEVKQQNRATRESTTVQEVLIFGAALSAISNTTAWACADLPTTPRCGEYMTAPDAEFRINLRQPDMALLVGAYVEIYLRNKMLENEIRVLRYAIGPDHRNIDMSSMSLFPSGQPVVDALQVDLVQIGQTGRTPRLDRLITRADNAALRALLTLSLKAREHGVNLENLDVRPVASRLLP